MRYNVRGVSSAGTRRCGLAVYLKNLFWGMKDFTSEIAARDIAAIDNENLIYPQDVDVIINQYNKNSWLDGARDVGVRALEKSDEHRNHTIVYINHEFGLGGRDWEKEDNYIPFLKELRNTEAYKKGILHLITCLHTILARPSNFHRSIVRGLMENSDGVIVLADCAKKILASDRYSIDTGKSLIRHLEHGVRMYEYSEVDRNDIKESWGVNKDTFLIVFSGLISEGKGIFKYGVPGYTRAVEKLRRLGPDIKTRCFILGQCHPNFEKTPKFNDFIEKSLKTLNSTELLLNKNPFKHRLNLNQLNDMRTSKNKKHGICVIYNYLTEKDYSRSFAAADLLCFPYLEKQQISSGQIAEAMGHGRDTIATKFWHALEMLSEANEIGTLEDLLDPYKMPREGKVIGIDDPDARGLLVDCDRGEKTVEQIANSIVYAITDEDAHQLRSENSHEKGHDMLWKNVAWQTQHFGDYIRKRKSRKG